MLQRCADRFERFVLIGSSPHEAADRPRAQSDARDVRLQTVHFCIFHNTGPASECFFNFLLQENSSCWIAVQDDNEKYLEFFFLVDEAAIDGGLSDTEPVKPAHRDKLTVLIVNLPIVDRP